MDKMFKVGEWYRHLQYDDLVCIKEILENTVKYYGFRKDVVEDDRKDAVFYKEMRNLKSFFNAKRWRKTSRKEVEEALINEINKGNEKKN